MAMLRRNDLPNLGPSKETPRIRNKPITSKKTKKPSELMEERQAAKEKNRTLGESLSEAAMIMPAGEGMVGKALKAGVSGAAAGATIGEALAKLHQEKAQKGTPQKPRSMSESVMSGGDDVKKRKRAAGRPESENP